MIDELKITSLKGRGTLFLKKCEYWSYWLGPVDWGEVEGQHQTYKFYRQVGESITDTVVRSRPLSITGWVIDAGTGDMQERCDYLNQYISPVEDYELEYNGKKITFRPDSSIIYFPEQASNNEKVRKFMIQATCPYPLFSDAESTAVPFDKTEKLFRFPTDFGQNKPLVFADVGKAYRVAVNNKGGFAAGMTLLLKFSGEVKNPRVKNLTTGKMIGMRHTFQRGEQLEICTVPGSKRMTLYTLEGEQEDVLKWSDYRSAYDMQLQPGINEIALDCDDLDQRVSMDVTLYYATLYLEVE